MTQDAHQVYMDQVTTMAKTFALDFGSAEHPGYVKLSEITSFLYLAVLNRSEFRRAIHDLLQNNPFGRFLDPSALMTQLQAWNIANCLSFASDETSLKGSALVAAKTLGAPKIRSTPKDKTKPKTPHLYPTPCTWCLAADKVSRFGHLSSYCSKNTNRILTLAPTPTTPITRTPSNMSTRLHALLSQLDESETPQSVALYHTSTYILTYGLYVTKLADPRPFHVYVHVYGSMSCTSNRCCEHLLISSSTRFTPC